MARLESYAEKFRFIRFRREDGILEMRLHNDGGPAVWTINEGELHDELGEAFYQVGHDRENRVVIFTGTGEHFLADMAVPPQDQPVIIPPAFWARIYHEGKDLIDNLLNIPVPVISAVHGNAFVHSELPVLSDIVLASETARFADKAHFLYGVVPGDGVQIAWSALIGVNRMRYFLLTGQEIDARTAHQLGVVAEVLPSDQLLPRAWALARDIAAKPELACRFTREVFTLELKRRMREDAGHALMLEGLAMITPAA